MSYANQIIHFLNETDHCYPCRSPCDTYCIFIYSPPPPPPPSLSSPHHQNLSLLFFIIIAILSLLFLIVSYYTIFSKYCFIRNRSPTRPQTQIQQTHEQFLDENHPSVVDHPIWFIKTVGLDQSTINSITVITYKKQDRLVEGTDCSVCLSEFEEDEELRLLPKCSHAFHLPCIDTWLGSHKNCPMCRAPIVSVINPVVDSTTAASGEENLVDGGVVGSDDHRGESVEERELMDGLNFIWNNAIKFQSEMGTHDRWNSHATFDGGFVSLCHPDDLSNFCDKYSQVVNARPNESVVEVGSCSTSTRAGGACSTSSGGGDPHEALLYALGYLGLHELLSIESVCKSLHSAVQNDLLLWRNIYIDQPLSERIDDDALLRLTNKAQGNLQCLSLVECSKITDDGLKLVLESNLKMTKVHLD